MTLQKKRGRLPVEQDKIAAFIRKNIISGKWPAGHKIPTHIELSKKFRVTTVTIQRTLTSLISDGFLRLSTIRNRGTCVNETSPHLFNYALVFPCAPHESEWKMFFSALLDVSSSLQKELGITINPYYQLDGNPTRTDYIRLVNDIRKERLAGIIFASAVFMMEKTPAVLEGNIPKIIIGNKREIDSIPNIRLNDISFIQKSLDYLVSRKCRRVAFISGRSQSKEFREQIKLSFARRKLIYVPQWHHYCHLGWTEPAANIVHLLMSSLPKTKRPDAILVGDDNLIGPVCEGLKLANVKIPGELELVSHCNFPKGIKPALPVQFIGYNINELMCGCLEILKLRKSSTEFPMMTELEACPEEEFTRCRNRKVFWDNFAPSS